MMSQKLAVADIDRGWAWLVLVGVSCGLVLQASIMYAGGVIYVTLLEEFHDDYTKTSLVGSITRLSGNALLFVCLGWRRVMTFEIGRLFEIGWQSADHRASAGRFQRTSPVDLPIPQLTWRCPQSADCRPMPGRCPPITCRYFYDC